MPLAERILTSPLSYVPPDQKELRECRVDLVLDKVTMNGMEGTLKQFMSLTSYAADIFNNLYQESQKTFNRATTVAKRVNSLRKEMEEMDPEILANRLFSKTEATESHAGNAHSIFTKESMPVSIRNAYDSSIPPPDFSFFDQPDADPPMLFSDKYSNPNFFLEKWIEAELLRQNAQEEKKKKRREARKDRKKSKKKGASENHKQRIKVAQVEVKHYNPLGADWGEAQVASKSVGATPTNQGGTSQNYSLADETPDLEDDLVSDISKGLSSSSLEAQAPSLATANPERSSNLTIASTGSVSPPPFLPSPPESLVPQAMGMFVKSPPPPPLTLPSTNAPAPPPIAPPPFVPPPVLQSTSSQNSSVSPVRPTGGDMRSSERISAPPTLLDQIRSVCIFFCERRNMSRILLINLFS